MQLSLSRMGLWQGLALRPERATRGTAPEGPSCESGIPLPEGDRCNCPMGSTSPPPHGGNTCKPPHHGMLVRRGGIPPYAVNVPKGRTSSDTSPDTIRPLFSREAICLGHAHGGCLCLNGDFCHAVKAVTDTIYRALAPSHPGFDVPTVPLFSYRHPVPNVDSP